ncbi:MAG: hypothetical protein IKB60_03075 [Clostridia bacterium]|nr:hypothetical protein [Clostridia bacterium]
MPTNILKHVYNKATAHNLSGSPTLWDKWVWFDLLELALYKENSFLD